MNAKAHRVQTQRSEHASGYVDLLVWLACVGLLMVVVLPWLARAKTKGGPINCIYNLKQVGLSFRIWAGDNGGLYPMQVASTNGGTMDQNQFGFAFPHFMVMSNELSTPKLLICPRDIGRTSASNFTSLTDPNVSYFVGLDADETNANRILTSDRNLTSGGKAVGRGLVLLSTNQPIGWTTAIHKNAGNICLADGSVQQVTSKKLYEAFINAALATNRLAVP